MKSIRQLMAVLVWCAMSVGCWAEEIKQLAPASTQSRLVLDKWENKELCTTLQPIIQAFADTSVEAREKMPPVKIGDKEAVFAQWELGGLSAVKSNRADDAYFTHFDANGDGKSDLVIRELFTSSGGGREHHWEELHILSDRKLENRLIDLEDMHELDKMPSMRFFRDLPEIWHMKNYKQPETNVIGPETKIALFFYNGMPYFIFPVHYNPWYYDGSDKRMSYLVGLMGERIKDQPDSMNKMDINRQCVFKSKSAVQQQHSE